MSQLLKTWWKAFSFYAFWDSYEERPLVGISFEAWFTETRPLTFSDTLDTGRWRGLHLRAHLSKYLIGMTIPFRTLPDHIPTERQLRMREVYSAPKKL